MSVRKKIANRLIRPNGILAAAAFVLCALAVTGALLLLGFGFADEWYTYTVYATAALTLGYFVYALVRLIPQWVNRLTNRVKSGKITGALLGTYETRAVFFTAVSLFVNVAFAVFQGVLSILSGNVFLGMHAVYYVILSVVQSIAVPMSVRKVRGKGKRIAERTEWASYISCGGLLILLAAILPAAIVWMVISDKNTDPTGWFIYASAAFAFYKIVMSAINLAKAKRRDGPLMRMCRATGFVGALVSLLSLQTALLATFGDDATFSLAMNAVSGGVLVIAVLAVGIVMTVVGTKKRNALLALPAEDGRGERAETESGEAESADEEI